MAPRSPTVQSVSRALDLVEALARHEEVGLVELAAKTGLQPSTAHRLLATLVARRFVVRNAATGKYMLGSTVNELSEAVSKRTEHLRLLVRPHLETIKKVTRESANLTILEPPNIVYVDQVEGSHSVRMFARIGAAVPAYATAAGKAILAHVHPDAVGELLRGASFEQLTPRTIATPDELIREIDRVRRRGYALDQEEQEVGVGCVAAPIVGAAGAVGALSVSAPITRIRAADPRELGELLIARAAAVSRELVHA